MEQPRRAARPWRLAGWLALVLAAPAAAAERPAPDAGLLRGLRARLIGPAAPGGRITDVAVVESKPAILYVAAASGGLWKTVNRGTTWQPVFDGAGTASLGAVAVAPSNPDVVWVGTGEANPRNSVSWGDGVYRSTDAGRTWKNMGLRPSHHIGRIVIHPTRPEVVYVAALGHLWGPNPGRGLYRTTDAGRTWELVKFVNADTGFIDVAMDPADPDVLYAAAYQVRRDAFAGGDPAVQVGPGSGLYKTTDAGRTWTKLTRGLPDRPLGRCGLAVSRTDPRLVYAVVQTDRTKTGIRGQAAGKDADASTGGVFRSTDRGATWTKLNSLCPRPFYYGQIRIDPTDPRRVYVLGVELHLSANGGRTFSPLNAAPAVHPDHHALWIDPRDPDRLVLGGDGGLYFSYDRGATWEHLRNLPIGQFYAVAVDNRRPYRVYGGLQDNGVWRGVTATTRAEGITNADWFKIFRGDGFRCRIDPLDPQILYAESQFGHLRRVDLRTGAETVIEPVAPKGAPAYRFNWNAPFLLSPHGPRTIYFGGNHVFKSTDRGTTWSVVSPDLTRGRPGRTRHTGHTITALAESPLRAGLLFAGTDDGRVHVTFDGGGRWTELTGNLPRVPGTGWVTRLVCSRFDQATVYLTLDRHRQDDRAPYVFKSTNSGTTWRSLAATLPPGGPVHVIREDPRNADLLYLGTEFGLFVSLDGGRRWLPLKSGLPTVPVHDLVVHPRERELVVGTHGRSVYVVDVLPLQELTAAVRDRPAHLFPVKPAALVPPRDPAWDGAKVFAARNPPSGAVLYYYLRTAAARPVRVTITDVRGRPVETLHGPTEPGLHRLVWNVNKARTEAAAPKKRPVAAGEYQATLQAGPSVSRQKIIVTAE